ncbi:MAG: GNAT family N-acetyltransferase [Methanospirillum sp.]|nr:GNAT family N-acetyltransferase [Methanospirillum sp.]
MDLVIRPAVPADARGIAANNRATALETEGWEIGQGTALAGVLAVLEQPGRGFYLVADEDGEVVGQCMVTFEWSDWRNGEFWWVQSVYTRPSHRRRGIFARIYRAVEAMARDSPGVVGLRLYVEVGNEAARAAYRRLGMRPAPYLLLERDYAREQEGRA